MKIYKKWDVVLVNLDPTKGAEKAKARPCLVVSPNVVNMALNSLIIVPFTSASKTYPTRLFTTHNGIPGSLAFDQIKTIVPILKLDIFCCKEYICFLKYVRKFEMVVPSVKPGCYTPIFKRCYPILPIILFGCQWRMRGINFKKKFY